MEKILVLGAGMVAAPLVRYLLSKTESAVTVCDQDPTRAKALLAGHPKGRGLALNATDEHELTRVISDTDIVISLLPWTFHPTVARHCLKFGKHLITASYVKEEMAAMGAEASKRGLLFLNEMGVDPGVDHMATKKVIDGVQSNGGRITSYFSHCGGLPALESNNNPLGYKFSWSPVGALLATENNGRYLSDGKVVEIAGCKLFRHYSLIDVPGAGVFESYVNRDALPYRKVYGIEDTSSIYRGTLRNIGYCETWGFFKQLGLMNRQMKFDFSEVTPRQAIANLVRSDGGNLKGDVAAFLKIPEYALTIKKLEWLGLLSDKKVDLGTASIFDLFAHILQKRLVYHEGEMDLLVQHHVFIAAYPDSRIEKITSTLIDTGIPNGDSSMSRTVGYPVAIAARLLAEGKIDLTGVQIPVTPQLYEPILNELATLGIAFSEQRHDITAGTQGKITQEAS